MSSVKRYLVATSCISALWVMPSVAAAQEVPPPAVAAADDSEDAEIVVTGSRIRREQTSQPTIELGGALIEERGYTNVGEALTDLPQFGPGVSTFGTTGTTSSGSAGGQTFINFYGLGTQRTLTLLNGRRVVSGNSLSNSASAGVQVDLNIFPTALIERVDVVSVGGAPIYGSDAISGVVNIILKDNFEGLELDAQYGITERGDGAEYRLRGTWGGNFGDGRGNAVLSMEYTSTESLNQLDRADIFAGPGFQSNRARIALAGGVIPSQILVRDQRVHVATKGGIPLLGNGTTDNAVNTGVPSGAASAVQFAGNGDLIPYRPGITNELLFADGGDGLFLPDWVDLRQESKRFIASSFADYDVTDGVTIFAEGLFAQNDSRDPRNSPFINSNAFPNGPRDVIPVLLSNPFLTAQARGVLTAALDTNRDGIADRAIIDTNGDRIADAPGFFLSQFSDKYQNGAPSENQIQTYRGVIGAKGDFEALSRKFNWDISYNYGRTDSSFSEPDRLTGAFYNAVNAVAVTSANRASVPGGTFVVRGGQVISVAAGGALAGDIVCASSLNSALSRGPGRGGCVPLNPFGGDGISKEALSYFIVDKTSRSRLEQQVVQVNLAGELFRLPAGPLKFALGYERRVESGSFDPDSFFKLGLGDAPSIAGIQGSFSTNEFLAELSVPVLSPEIASFGPFEISLDLEGAGRLVKNSAVATKATYTGGARLSLMRGLSFRGNYTRSIRAPALTELFLPVQRVDSFANDPCDIDNIGNGANPSARRANCIAAVIANGNANSAAGATTFLSGYESIIDNALQPITAGGNPNLDNEIATSYTIGTTIAPAFIPNLSLSFDWVDISIANAIFNVNGSNLMSACFDSSAYPVAVCDSVFRGSDFQVSNLITGFANIGYIKFRSLTGQLRYNVDLGNFGELKLGVTGQYIDKSEISVLGTGDDLNINAGEPANPRFTAQANVNWIFGGTGVLLQTQFRGKSDINKADRDYETLQYPFIGSYTEFNLALSQKVNDQYSIRFVIDNLADRKPQVQAVASGNAYLFDVLGRRFRVGVSGKF
ncbi:MAG: cirA 12 [Sphingomonas bacterium]|nr:cirA 12 [Sphingomonas bacterium]